MAYIDGGFRTGCTTSYTVPICLKDSGANLAAIIRLPEMTRWFLINITVRQEAVCSVLLNCVRLQFVYRLWKRIDQFARSRCRYEIGGHGADSL
jgi:hypothetical protein